MPPLRTVGTSVAISGNRCPQASTSTTVLWRPNLTRSEYGGRVVPPTTIEPAAGFRLAQRAAAGSARVPPFMPEAACAIRGVWPGRLLVLASPETTRQRMRRTAVGRFVMMLLLPGHRSDGL